MFSGHNVVNIVNTALLQSKVPRGLVEKFSSEFNWPVLEENGFENNIVAKNRMLHGFLFLREALKEKTATLTQQETWTLNGIMRDDNFDEKLCDLMKKYIKHHQIILEFCDKMEEFFSPYMLVKVYLNRLYFCLELLCVLLVSYYPPKKIV